jgi:sulfite dehydrogenase
MGGMEAAAKVDVSLDGGKTWNPARLVGPNLGKYAWRQFVFATTLKPGEYELACRTTDSTGTVQLATSPENTGGYLNSGWISHAIKVTVV